MIVVVGESLIDVVVDPDGDIHEEVGGSPLNVAVGLARLEVPAMLITEVGHDERGGRILQALSAAEVEVVSPAPASGTTATATAHLDAVGIATYDFDLGWSLPHQELPHCDALHVGSLGTVIEPGRDSVLDLVDQAYARGVFVSYDPNVRPAFLEDRTSAWRDIEALAERANLVKMSEEDVEALHPGADPGVIATSLLSGERTELVVITHGGDGAAAYADGVSVSVPAPPTDLVDTVGAGDSFMSAMLTILYDSGATGPHGEGVPADEEGLTRLLSGAVRVAAITCERRGAQPPTRSEVPDGWPG